MKRHSRLADKAKISYGTITYMAELKIRGGSEDNSKIIFLINENICCDPTLELSQ